MHDFLAGRENLPTEIEESGEKGVRETEFPEGRSQTEFGNEGNEGTRNGRSLGRGLILLRAVVHFFSTGQTSAVVSAEPVTRMRPSADNA